jgi:peptide deformylase
MELQLVDENDPVLKQAAEPYDFDNWIVEPNLEELVKAMTKTMFLKGGIGLAAPQVGISKRILIMGNEEKLIVCVNPELVSGEGEVQDIEGCLSFPGLWLHVKRYKKIIARYQTINGETKEEEFEDLMARVFQHELDHLNGHCFVEKVGKLSLQMAQKRRKKNLR